MTATLNLPALRNILALGLLLCAYSVLPIVTHAQLNLGVSEPLSIALSPTYPRPGGTVSVSPQSTQINFANSTMRITVDGKEVYSGQTRATPVPLKGVGQTTTIRVSVTEAGQTFAKTVSVTPGDVSLVAEPIATAPALYKGRPLVPESGNVRLVAVADFRTSPTARLDPDLLSYTWSMGGITLIEASGIGRTSVVVPAPLQYRNQTVSVVVQSQGGSLVGGDSTALLPQSPTLRLYANDSLQGILFDRALNGQFTIAGNETTITAVPYSFPGSKPTMQWFLNGSAAETGSNITLRPEGAGEGSASLSVTARDTGANSISATLSLIFGTASTNFFGL